MGSLAERFPRYSKLLRLYPAPYRAQYGEQMLQTLADMLDHEPERQTTIWLRAIVDLPLSAARQQLNYAAVVMAHEMPQYVKRNAAISALLLVPFILALLANSADQIINNQTLFHSWLWHMPTLALWVLWLPLMAALIALGSLLALLLQRSKAERTNVFRQLLDVEHNWPLLTVGVLALFVVAAVFGHDSVHCVTGNPVRELHNWHQTWQCIQQR